MRGTRLVPEIFLGPGTHTQSAWLYHTDQENQKEQSKPGKEGLLARAMQEWRVRALEARRTGWAKVKPTQSPLGYMPQTFPRNLHNPWSAEFLNFGPNG